MHVQGPAALSASVSWSPLNPADQRPGPRGVGRASDRRLAKALKRAIKGRGMGVGDTSGWH